MERFNLNVHGHMHTNIIENDNRYMNVSVEKINYTPVDMDTILVNYLPKEKE